MSLNKLMIATVAVAMVGLGTPTYAQRGGGGHGGGGSHGGGGGGGTHGGGGQMRSGASQMRGGGGSFGAPRSFSGSVNGQQSFSRTSPSFSSRAPFQASRGFNSVNGGVRTASPQFVGGTSYARVAAPRVVGSRVFVSAPFHGFAHPYYAFHSHFSIGFGLYVGYPVAFPYWAYDYPYYGYPAYGYGYPYAAPYGYPGPAPYPYTSVAPTQIIPGSQPGVAEGPVGPDQNFGGLSFSITPSNAEIFVDGQDMGVASSFSATSQPLALTPGQHHVEIRASGYRTATFDVEVHAGEVVPYQGTLER